MSSPVLNNQKHIKYWLRCLKTCLPTEYTSTDLNRLTLAFFCVSALDLLGELSLQTTPAERTQWVDWIYTLQLPTGGFRGSPATDFGPFLKTESNSKWDPASLPASYFAITTLATLGDDFTRMNREGLLALLPRLQRKDGSFGEWIGPAEEVVGGSDMRLVYFAVAIRWVLRGAGAGEQRGVGDFDVEAVVRFIRSSENYDHGIAEQPYGEAHAGLTYCALASLSLLDRLHPSPTNQKKPIGISSHDNLIKWLVHCQSPHLPSDSQEDDDENDDNDNDGGLIPEDITPSSISSPGDEEGADLPETDADGKPLWAGFCGRSNKKTDTCYSFWVGGSLDVLGKLHLVNLPANRRFLLEKTQNFIGGFSKSPQLGSRPDILHSFMGLAALSLMKEDGLEPLDPALCVSLKAKERLLTLSCGVREAEI